MRKRFAKHLRKEVIRNGVNITSEGYIMTRGEMSHYSIPKHKRGYEVEAEFDGCKYLIAHPYDALGAYRFLLEAIHDNKYLLGENHPGGGET